MPRIAIIGAGGYVFPLRLIEDILSFEELRDSTLALQDIDAGRLERVATVAKKLVQMHDLPTRIEATTDQRAAIAGADFVIVTFQVGGLEAYRLDVEIPRKYGVDQTVGDTLGPGGVFRGLRSMVVYDEICANIHAVAKPDTLLINYANPMAINCWDVALNGVKHVGLCHSIQGTSHMMARTIGVPYNDVIFQAAGINHQCWFTKFRRRSTGEDLLPRVRETMARECLGIGGEPTKPREGIYEGPHNDRTRTAVLEYVFGQGYRHPEKGVGGQAAFISESPHHTSEYFSYFRRTPADAQKWVLDRWDYYECCCAHDEAGQVEHVLERTKEGFHPSHEYGSWIIHSMVTNTPRVIYGNVPNTGLITNLPEGCCVEVPCLVDGNGIQPTYIGDLPPTCAAINRTNINVQELAVQGHRARDRYLIQSAIALDPLTAATCPVERIPEMVDALFTAQKQWLPQFEL